MIGLTALTHILLTKMLLISKQSKLAGYQFPVVYACPNMLCDLVSAEVM